MWIRTEKGILANMEHVKSICLHDNEIRMYEPGEDFDAFFLVECSSPAEAEAALNRIHQWLDDLGMSEGMALDLRTDKEALDETD